MVFDIMATSMNIEEAHQWMLENRGIENPCKECGGWGVKAYATTSTWHSGAGGMTITNGVCNICWGSGDEIRKWPSHRKALYDAKEVQRLREMYVNLATD